MSFYQDKHVKGCCIFLTVFAALMFGTYLLFGAGQTAAAKNLYLTHDGAVAASLLEQGVPEHVIAAALTSTETSEAGEKLLAMIGIREQTGNRLLPFVAQFQRGAVSMAILIALLLTALFFAGMFGFFEKRKRLYLQADEALHRYLAGDYSTHLPQNSEGAIFQIFASVEQLATMLQAKSEAEHKTKEFLKRTISDISHQLKTPLAALAMYQEIIESEPDHVDAVKQFSAKIGAALKRMESLIQSMLKIARLDTGSIVFETHRYPVSEVILRGVSELSTRAEAEGKKILFDGDSSQQLICNMEWTSEAIGNIVKNALDHTGPGGIIRIAWERTPLMLRIFISDNGNGIAPDDIHHIFKRFYRSKHTLDTQGIGLGLPLAKSVIEGQEGLISVQSTPNAGTTFTVSFLTEL